ncbi:MAG: hypothetical protein ACXWQR_00515 [Ktedonobacterales bacterium]
MAVRSSMTDLITRVRVLIGDGNPVSGNPYQFGDQDIQDALDLKRVWVRSAVLRPAPSLTSNGIISYQDYFADQGNWESDVVIQDAAFHILSDMSASDYLTGQWTWNLASPGKIPPIFITGKFYDIYGAAADLLEKWAAFAMRAYDVTMDGTTLRRSQMAQGMLTQAKQYRKQALVHVIPMTRSDMNDDSSGTNVIMGNTDVMGW